MPFWTKLHTYHSLKTGPNSAKEQRKSSQFAMAALDFYS